MHLSALFSASVILLNLCLQCCLNLTFVECNTLRHEKRKQTSTRTDSSEKSSSENEKVSAEIVKTTQPPEYLNLIYDRLTELDFSTGTSENFGPILRALFPSEITNGEFGSTFLVYNTNHTKVDKFSSAHLILTRVGNEEIDQSNESHLNVNIQMKNHESILSQRLSGNDQFYTFDITTLLREALNRTGRFDLECDVFNNIRRKKIWFNQVFSTATEKPFVILAYLKPVQSYESSSGRIRRHVEPLLSTLGPSSPPPLPTQELEILSEHHTAEKSPEIELSNHLPEDDDDDQMDNTINPIPIHTQQFRPSPHKSMCRRYEWLVSPEEIGLQDVLKPDKIDLGYCAGSCPYPLLNDYFNFTIHSFFVDQYRLGKGFDLPRHFPTSNCVPVSYQQVVVMEVETDGGFLFRTFSDAAVGSCGCR